MRRRIALLSLAIVPAVAVVLIARRSSVTKPVEKLPPVPMEGDGQVGPPPSPTPTPTPTPRFPDGR